MELVIVLFLIAIALHVLTAPSHHGGNINPPPTGPRPPPPPKPPAKKFDGDIQAFVNSEHLTKEQVEAIKEAWRQANTGRVL